MRNITDFNFGDYDYRSPLYFAVRMNQYEAAKYLLSQGVNANNIDRWGGTALNYVSDTGTPVYKLLKQYNAKLGVP